MIVFQKVEKEFKKYVEQFDLKNMSIAMKVSHSYHVADLANKLAKRMELSEEQTELVKTIGLLHDMGRFVQYKETEEYNDIKNNINHAEIADMYLFVENHIEDFGVSEEYYPLIRMALINHNKLKIEENLNEEFIFFAKFLRDIDKMDIFRQQATSYEWKYKEATEEVMHDFKEHHLVDNRKIKTKTDELVSELAYTFDINFKESYELLIDTDNLELYFSIVEVEKGKEQEFEEIKKELRNYIEERIEEIC